MNNRKIFELLVEIKTSSNFESKLVTWAEEMILEGNDTPSIILLAGLNVNEYNEALELFNKSINELGYSIPSEKDILLYAAKLIAENIANNKIHINEGCDKIKEIAIELNYPEELIEFVHLSHEQYGHEHLGIDSENIRPDILNAAKKLLSN